MAHAAVNVPDANVAAADIWPAGPNIADVAEYAASWKLATAAICPAGPIRPAVAV